MKEVEAPGMQDATTMVGTLGERTAVPGGASHVVVRRTVSYFDDTETNAAPQTKQQDQMEETSLDAVKR